MQPFHLFLKFFEDRIIFSAQKFYCFLHRFPICFLTNIILTRCIALLNVIVQTWSLFPDVFWQIPVTAPYVVQFSQQFNRIFDTAPALAIYQVPEILRLIFFHLSCKQNPRICLLYRHFNKRIRLVIPSYGIVFISSVCVP